MYDLMSIEEKDKRSAELQVPPWEKKPRSLGKIVSDVKNEAVMISTIVGAFRDGSIRTEPELGAFEAMGIMRDIDDIFSRDRREPQRRE